MEAFVTFVFNYLNLGLASGLILGILLLTQPAAERLLTPRQRVALWYVGWIGAYMPQIFSVLYLIRLLPWSFRDWITPRTAGPWGLPAYLPGDYRGPGEYNLAFPGGGAVQVRLTDGLCLTLALLWLAGAAAMGCQLCLGVRRLRKRALAGERLEEGHPFYNICDGLAGIWLCDDIPTSFVDSGTQGYRIFLQRGLTPGQMELVLRHENNHIKLRHCIVKLCANVGLVLHWWNPLIWLAYFAFCRDLELDCDSRTLRELDPAQRREYARTLLELGAGRQLWNAPLSFGECNAAVRVKAAVAWRPPGRWRNVLGWCAALLVFACLAGGPWGRERILSADQQLLRLQMQRQWQDMTGEGMERFLQAQEEQLKQKGWLTQQAHIVHAWMKEEQWSIRMWYQLDDGAWREIVYIWDDRPPGGVQIGYKRNMLMPYSLADYCQVY